MCGSMHDVNEWISSIASPICQEGQSERTFPIFPLFLDLFPIVPLFFLIFPSFSWFLTIFFHCQGGALTPLPLHWLRHWNEYKLLSVISVIFIFFIIFIYIFIFTFIMMTWLELSAGRKGSSISCNFLLAANIAFD